jgi:hypothetical protein
MKIIKKALYTSTIGCINVDLYKNKLKRAVQSRKQHCPLRNLGALVFRK